VTDFERHHPGDVAPSVVSMDGNTNPHFAAIGGEAGIERLVERFYYYMDSLVEARGIRAMHPPDLAPVVGVLRRYLTEWMGGPALYSPEKGHPRLRRRHLPFAIGASERDAWMLCMRRALADTVNDAALRAQLDTAFYKVANFMRNETQETPTVRPSNSTGQ
jgi:hemoglobin